MGWGLSNKWSKDHPTYKRNVQFSSCLTQFVGFLTLSRDKLYLDQAYTFCYHHSQQRSTNCSCKLPHHGQILLEVIYMKKRNITVSARTLNCWTAVLFYSMLSSNCNRVEILWINLEISPTKISLPNMTVKLSTTAFKTKTQAKCLWIWRQDNIKKQYM